MVAAVQKSTRTLAPVTNVGNLRSTYQCKDSIVSETVAHTERFRGANTIEKYREQYCKGREVKENVVFKSASTAANFVTGSSTNGLTAWKDVNGKSLKELSIQ